MGIVSSLVGWVHITAVVVVIGGSALVLLFLRPLALKTLEPPVAMGLMGALQMRFRWAIWGAILLLVVTGVWSAVAFRGMTSLDALFNTPFGQALLIKSVLAAVLFGNALAITLPLSWLGWFRKRAPTIMHINLVLATVIILVASFLVRRGGLF